LFLDWLNIVVVPVFAGPAKELRHGAAAGLMRVPINSEFNRYPATQA
jgi:hypothetical protein